jgi:phosphohistidine phosphatase SixA
MKALPIAVLAFWLALITWAPSIDAQQEKVPIQELKRGGYVILFRHGETSESILPRQQRTPEPSPMDLANCEIQDKLTENGREETRAIGAGFQRLGIPVGRVVSSSYCRALDTARLAFGRVDELSPFLLHRTYVPVPGAPAPSWEQRATGLRQLLATPPTAGTNTVLVTHGANVLAAVAFDPAELEAAIFKPDGQGGFTLVARVLPKAWLAQPGP